ncbi:hypothetical protein IEQ34_008681 [Dendrobium chrysotoxum]|uniref:Kinesin motor domain-containing protein n=1 Tax=Dendrobium chrysotoxum TaxID=161865 RepID=A0AAV7GYE7_DENCH|nr:hypothetical protein IEQ34_008681 [Dendrobium chrysotoxum]
MLYKKKNRKDVLPFRSWAVTKWYQSNVCISREKCRGRHFSKFSLMQLISSGCLCGMCPLTSGLTVKWLHRYPWTKQPMATDRDPSVSRNECYKLDSFFGQEDQINLIFQKEVSSVIPGIFHEHNATVFTYGETGSGKTYTMHGTENELGLIP